jgi:hypothetical protein
MFLQFVEFFAHVIWLRVVGHVISYRANSAAV